MWDRGVSSVTDHLGPIQDTVDITAQAVTGTITVALTVLLGDTGVDTIAVAGRSGSVFSG